MSEDIRRGRELNALEGQELDVQPHVLVSPDVSFIIAVALSSLGSG